MTPVGRSDQRSDQLRHSQSRKLLTQGGINRAVAEDAANAIESPDPSGQNPAMSIERAEQLKRELTDRHVKVATGVPELRRFEGLTGLVRTVNMNCRALVEFDGLADIGWYDIDPQYLTVVQVQKTEAVEAPEVKAEAPSVKPAGTAPTGASPLDQIRAQATGKTAPEAPGRKSAGLSPLDQIRQSAGGPARPPAQPQAAEQPKASEPKTARATSGLSPLEQIRASSGGAAPPARPSQSQHGPDSDAEPSEPDAAETTEAVTQPENTYSVTPKTLPDYGSGDSTPTIFDQIYQQAGLTAEDAPPAPNVFQQVRNQVESNS